MNPMLLVVLAAAALAGLVYMLFDSRMRLRYVVVRLHAHFWEWHHVTGWFHCVTPGRRNVYMEWQWWNGHRGVWGRTS